MTSYERCASLRWVLFALQIRWLIFERDLRCGVKSVLSSPCYARVLFGIDDRLRCNDNFSANTKALTLQRNLISPAAFQCSGEIDFNGLLLGVP